MNMDLISFVTYEKLISKGDPYMEDWPMVKYPHAMLSWLAAYLIMVILLPKFMNSRRPFDLRTILICYNLGMVFVSSYIFLQAASAAIELHYEWCCPKYEFVSTASHLKMSKAMYLYFLTKFLEFSDTLFLILRKKNTQLTMLHVYHHGSIAVIQWMTVKLMPGGILFLYPILNCPVHVVMYAYYGLAAFGPKIQKYLWWKKYITQIQLIQFVIGLSSLLRGFYRQCDYPIELRVLGAPYLAIFIILFLHFYITTYSKPKKIVTNGVTKSKLL